MPIQDVAPVVEVSQLWPTTDAEWVIRPEVHVSRLKKAIGGQEISAVELWRRYGNVKEPHESAIAVRAPIDLDGWFIRIRFLDAPGNDIAFVGKIYSQSVAGGASDAGTPQGVQRWHAYDMAKWLTLVRLNRSHWLTDYDDGGAQQAEQVIGWFPKMNDRDGRNLVEGNRSLLVVAPDDVYVFGDAAKWSRRQFLDYVLRKFADQDDDSPAGPIWQVGGTTSFLDDLEDSLDFGESPTLHDVISKLVPRSMGFDWTVNLIPQSDSPGFEVFVFPVQTQTVNFGGASIPGNTSIFSINTTGRHEATDVTIIDSLDNQYDRIRVQGRRIVACFSLYGARHFQDPNNATLVPKWGTTIEGDYKTNPGGSGSDADAQDKARRQDRFRPVYRLFGAPELWKMTASIDDFRGKIAAGEAAIPEFLMHARPRLSADGTVLNHDPLDGDPFHNMADFQNIVRNTLDYLPIFEAKIYPGGDPVDQHVVGYSADLLPAVAWIKGDKEGEDTESDEPEETYTLVEELGMSLSVSSTDWGIYLGVTPNHAVALNHFDPAAMGIETESEPKWDFETLITTLAIRSDQRLELEYENVSGASRAQKTLVINDPFAELWVIMPGTVLSVDGDGVPVVVPPAGPPLISEQRNDAVRIAALMAGAIARYAGSRKRLEIKYDGAQPWHETIGQVVGTVTFAGETHVVGALVTSIEWNFDGPHQTILRAGYAK